MWLSMRWSGRWSGRWSIGGMALGLGLGCSDAGQDLSAQQMSAVVTEAQPKLQACLQAALDRKSTDGAVDVPVVLHVAKSGKVSATELSLTADPVLESCLRDVFLALQFPTASAETHASLPLELRRHAPEEGSSP